MHNKHYHHSSEPAGLLKEYLGLFTERPLPGPVLDLASGDCRNGIFLARQGVQVLCFDVSVAALDKGRDRARELGVAIETRQVNLEGENSAPLSNDTYGGIIVFRYLHRPLMPKIKQALKEGGVLVYETYTIDQPQFGKPRNPDFLLKPGELKDWFSSWEVLHYFEGVRQDPDRAIAQIVCRKTVGSR